jgi:tartrate dehydratase beta subunit/fumarate hydratase class I family protein
VAEACGRHGGFYLGSIGGPAARLAQYLNQLHPALKGRYADLVLKDSSKVFNTELVAALELGKHGIHSAKG